MANGNSNMTKLAKDNKINVNFIIGDGGGNMEKEVKHPIHLRYIYISTFQVLRN